MTKQDYSNQWLKDLNLSRPLIITGPCSAETEEASGNLGRAQVVLRAWEKLG